MMNFIELQTLGGLPIYVYLGTRSYLNVYPAFYHLENNKPVPEEAGIVAVIGFQSWPESDLLFPGPFEGDKKSNKA